MLQLSNKGQPHILLPPKKESKMIKFYEIYETVSFKDNQKVKVDFSKFGYKEAKIEETTVVGIVGSGRWIIKVPKHLKHFFGYSCISCPQWFIVKE